MATERENASVGRLRFFRRCRRYSLRTFLLAVTVICLVLGLYVKRQRDRHLAIEAIKQWGGIVEFADNPHAIAENLRRIDVLMSAANSGSPRPVFPEEEPQGADWQRRLFGKYYGSSVFRVGLSKTVFSPSDAAIDLAILAPLTELKQLTLGDKQFDDHALGRVPQMSNLEALHLMDCTNISDRGLECLDRLPNLKHLQIMHGRFTAEGLEHIGTARDLTSLMLYSCDLTDDALKPLAWLQNLEELYLDKCTISDVGLAHIGRLRGLKNLRINETNVTEKGVNGLRRALPNCHIYSSFGYIR